MKRIPPDLLKEIVDRLVRELKPERIYLFGSQAYGQPDAGSDIDLFIIVPTSDLPRHRRAAQALGHLFGLACPIDVIIYTRDEVEKWANVKNSLPHKVLTRGRLLYATRR
ncbi:MAG: nucleotidyltransferase domain-containing protein [Anaerolineae bacterium]|nr:nucleotidyltransferase domain-containing protein [Anaerolineae bacterium]